MTLSLRIHSIAAAVVAGCHPAAAAWPVRSLRAAHRYRRYGWQEPAPRRRRDRRFVRRLSRDAIPRSCEKRRRVLRNSSWWTAPSQTPVDRCSAAQRGIDRASRGMPEPRGDITVGTQQITGAGRSVITRSQQSRGIAEAVAADPDDTDIVGDAGSRAVGKLEQRELLSRLDEG